MKQIKDLRAKYNANGNAIIPNTFQHPNIFVDRLMHYLTPTENTVLTYAVRRILGFQDNIMSRKDNISLSQFTDGIEAINGTVLSLGCGIGAGTVIKALEALEQYKILIPTSDRPDPKRGREYWLQDNELAIDWGGLEKRQEERIAKARLQTKKARYSVEQRTSVEQNPSVEQRATPSVEQNTSPLLNRDTKPRETQGNPLNGLAPEAIAEANKTVDFILENARKAKYPHREKFPEVLQWYADLYVELTGQEPRKPVLLDWITTFSEWQGMGLKSEHIRGAYKKLTEMGSVPTRPGSLTNTAYAIKSLGKVSQEQPRQKTDLEQFLEEQKRGA